MKLTRRLRFLLGSTFVVMQSYVVYLVSSEAQDYWGALKYLSVAVLVFVSAGFLATTNVLAKLNLSRDKTQSQIQSLSSELIESNSKLAAVDGELRKEIGGWLHGSVQSKLMAIARTLRTPGENFNPSVIADLVDDLNENTIREYSHRLFPPALHISLAMGLDELLDDDIELQMDDLLSESANAGIEAFTGKSQSKLNQVNDRLILPPTIAFAIYRIIEEAINNARKKSSVSKIKVAITVHNKTIHIEIKDNGEKLPTGFKYGLGLTLIGVYSSQFGGDFKLENTTDGVVLRASLKFEPTTVREVLTAKISAAKSKKLW